MLLERIVKHTQDEQAFRDLESALGKSLSCGQITFLFCMAASSTVVTWPLRGLAKAQWQKGAKRC